MGARCRGGDGRASWDHDRSAPTLGPTHTPHGVRRSSLSALLGGMHGTSGREARAHARPSHTYIAPLTGAIGVGGIVVVPILVQLPGITIKVAIAAAMFSYIFAGAPSVHFRSHVAVHRLPRSPSSLLPTCTCRSVPVDTASSWGC